MASVKTVETSIPGTRIGIIVPLRLGQSESCNIADVTITGTTGITILGSPAKAMNAVPVTINRLTYAANTCVIFSFSCTQTGIITIDYTGSSGTDQALEVTVLDDQNPPDIVQRGVSWPNSLTDQSNAFFQAGFIEGTGVSSATRLANTAAWRKWLTLKAADPNLYSVQFPAGTFEFEGVLDLVGNGLQEPARSWSICGAANEFKGPAQESAPGVRHFGTRLKFFLTEGQVFFYHPGSLTVADVGGNVSIRNLHFEVATVGSLFEFGDTSGPLTTQNGYWRGLVITGCHFGAPHESTVWATTHATNKTVLQTTRFNWALKLNNVYSFYGNEISATGFSGPQFWLRRCDKPTLINTQHYLPFQAILVAPGIAKSKIAEVSPNDMDGVPGTFYHNYSEGSICNSFALQSGHIEDASSEIGYATFTPEINKYVLPTAVTWAIHGKKPLPNVTSMVDSSGLTVTFAAAHGLKVNDKLEIRGTANDDYNIVHNVSAIDSTTVVKLSTGYSSSQTGTFFASTTSVPDIVSVANNGSGKTRITFDKDHNLLVGHRFTKSGGLYVGNHRVTAVISATQVDTQFTFTSTTTGTAIFISGDCVRFANFPTGNVRSYFVPGMLMRIAKQAGAANEEPELNLFVEEVDSTNNLVYFANADTTCVVPRVIPFDQSGSGSEVEQVFGVGINMAGERIGLGKYRSGLNLDRTGIPAVAVSPSGAAITVNGPFNGRAPNQDDMTQKLIVAAHSCGPSGALNGRITYIGESVAPHPLIDHLDVNRTPQFSGVRPAKRTHVEAEAFDQLFAPGHGLSSLEGDLALHTFVPFADSGLGYDVYCYSMWQAPWRLYLDSYPNVLYEARVYAPSSDGGNVYKKFEVNDGVTTHRFTTASGWNTFRGIVGSGATQFVMSQRQAFVAWVGITYPNAKGRRLPNSWFYGASMTQGAEATGLPTTTNFPADGDHGPYKNLTGPVYYWANNVAGAIKTVVMS